MQNASTRLLYTRNEAARQLSISVRSLDYFVANKEFDTRRIGRRVFITHPSLIRFAGRNHYDGVKTKRSDADAVASGDK